MSMELGNDMLHEPVLRGLRLFVHSNVNDRELLIDHILVRICIVKTLSVLTICRLLRVNSKKTLQALHSVLRPRIHMTQNKQSIF